MANSIFQRSTISYVAESTPGTTPATPSMLKLRVNDPLGGSAGKTLLESEEVLAHRQEEHTRHGRRSFEGSFPFELSYGAYNDWFEALLSGTWDANVLKVGTAVKTFTVEQRIASDIFLRGLGVAPSQLSLSIGSDSLITGSWDVIGMDFESSATSLGSPADVATNPPLDGLGNVAIEEGGASIGTVTSLDLTLNSNKTVGGIIGSRGGDTPTDGQFQITGTLTARFNSVDLFQKFENETDSSLRVAFTNLNATDELELFLPRLKYVSGNPTNNDNVIDGSFEFRALYDETAASSIVITDTPGA